MSKELLPCGVEKFTMKDGSEILMQKVRISHNIDGKVAMGNEIDPTTGISNPQSVKRIYFANIQRHVAMGWENGTGQLLEMPSEIPNSLRRGY